MALEIFKEIDDKSNEHKGIPFWSWNDKLEEAELNEQIEAMSKALMGGFFMHARGGLVTEYLSETWFALVENCINEAKKHDMKAWCYDENGWPSGFAAGIVPKMGEQYQQKGLEIFQLTEEGVDLSSMLAAFSLHKGKYERAEKPKIGDYIIKVNINPYYIDALNKNSITRFIEETHQKYYDRFKDEFGKTMQGFFTDEPQFANGLVVWSHVLPELFENKYGYNLIDNLILLYMDDGEYKSFRYDYYSLASELFVNGFLKQLYDWCEEHCCKLTGHVVAEDDLTYQVACTGGVMPCYEYFHMPGMDWLGRNIGNPVVPKQVGSVACQLGKPFALTETFALSGWDVSLNDLKWIAEWQFLNGINLICGHLESYSLRGFRKRDYPPSLFIQQPWFSEFSFFNNYINKLGAVLSDGKDDTKVLLLHPLKTAYMNFNFSNLKPSKKYSDEFIAATERLNALHIEHHYGDEELIRKYGKVENGLFYIGLCGYEKIVLPPIQTIEKTTFSLLLEFQKQGGEIFSFGEMPNLINARENQRINELTDFVKPLKGEKEIVLNLNMKNRLDISYNGLQSQDINYCMRLKEDNSRIYFVANKSLETQRVTLKLKGNVIVFKLDICTEIESEINTINEGEDTVFDLSFEGTESYILYVKNAESKKNGEKISKNHYIKLNNEFNIENQTANSLTLDKCKYKIDDGEWKEEKAIILIQKELLDLKKQCNIALKFNFNLININIIDEVFLAIECPTQQNIFVNDIRIDTNKKSGYFVDKSFEKLNIKPFLKDGINEILINRAFYQKQKVYDVLFGNVHESEKNMMTYDVELESCYLVGDFSVKNNALCTCGERKTIFTKGEFELAEKPNKIDISNITQQGYWFFSGSMTLSQSFHIEKNENASYILKFKLLNAPIARIFMNGIDSGTVAFAPFELDVTNYVRSGSNKISVELYSSNRNLLGPHHYAGGESYSVGPDTFTDTHGWSDNPDIPMWNDDYCFVEFGVEVF